MTTSSTLSLKLPPEVAKIMPWIIKARASGRPRDFEWAKSEYEIAAERARQRESRERERQENLRELQRERKDQEEREDEYFRRLQAQRDPWKQLGIHFAEEDGLEYLQPTQSSVKGFRRLLSEHDDLVDKRRYGKWGYRRSMSRKGHRSRRNHGRKPRTPWFK